MARDEIRRQALARVLAAFLPNLGLDGLRVVEQVATRMLLQQQRYGELDLSVPLDVSRFGIDPISSAVFAICAELGAEDCRRAKLHEQARDEMVPRTPPVEQPLKFVPGKPSDFECTACGATMGDWSEFEEYQHSGCLGLVRRRPATPTATIGQPDDDMNDPVVIDEFELDKHRTRLDSTPAVIALCEQPRDRDPDREVEMDFDVSDVDEPLSVHAPGGELGGEGGE